MKSVIALEKVHKNYQLGEVSVPAIAGLSLSIRKGEFVAIIGPSGSGKSTAMNLIGCLDIPTKGNIFLEDVDVASLGESELAQIRGRKIGFIFQQFNLIQTLSALENVCLPMTFQKIPVKERISRAKELLALVNLKDRANHKPSELSGGEQQRVAIARALANDPEIILADEPTGNLDSKSGREILNILRGLHRAGKTIVVITHDLSIAEQAQRIIRLKDGRIENEKSRQMSRGPPEDKKR